MISLISCTPIGWFVRSSRSSIRFGHPAPVAQPVLHPGVGVEWAATRSLRKGEPVRDLYVDVAATQRSHQPCWLILRLIQDLQAQQSLRVAMFMIVLHFLQNPHRIFYYFGYRALLLKISIPPKNGGISYVSRIGPPSFGAIWAIWGKHMTVGRKACSQIMNM